jgi:hypothetical protein
MKTNIADQLTKGIGPCKFLSICLGESTDVTPSAKLAVIALFCSGDKIREELINFVT